MIITSKRARLPIGRMLDTRAMGQAAGLKFSKRDVVLHHPSRGEYRGPFYVKRAVTCNEYADWYEAEYGEVLDPSEKQAMRAAQQRFYEISID